MKDPEVVEAFERVLRYELVASYGTPERAFRREETSDGWCYWCAGTESAYEKFLAGWSAAVIAQQDADIRNPISNENQGLTQQDADKNLVEMVHSMFRSGNDVPVTRITIDRNQYEAAVNAGRKEQE